MADETETYEELEEGEIVGLADSDDETSDELETPLSDEQAVALGESFDEAVSEASIKDLDETAFKALLRERDGDPILTEGEAQAALEAQKQAVAQKEFADFFKAQIELQRQKIAGLNESELEPEQFEERVYGDLTGLSEQEINALVSERIGRPRRPLSSTTVRLSIRSLRFVKVKWSSLFRFWMRVAGQLAR